MSSSFSTWAPAGQVRGSTLYLRGPSIAWHGSSSATIIFWYICPNYLGLLLQLFVPNIAWNLGRFMYRSDSGPLLMLHQVDHQNWGLCILLHDKQAPAIWAGNIRVVFAIFTFHIWPIAMINDQRARCCFPQHLTRWSLLRIEFRYGEKWQSVKMVTDVPVHMNYVIV